MDNEPKKHEREIIVQALSKPQDNPVVGPKISILDREGNWYGLLKKVAQDKWNDVLAIKPGDRWAIQYTVTVKTKGDGTKAYYSNIVDLYRIIQTQDEIPKEEAKEGTKPAPYQEMSPKQTCLKSATDFYVALIESGMVKVEDAFGLTDMRAVIMDTAEYFYRRLISTWETK